MFEHELHIKINPTPEEKVDELFDNYLEDCEYYKRPMYSKFLAMDLANIAVQRKNPFTENACAGIHYLSMLVWGNVCDTCDRNTINWLYIFAKAWLARETLPLFMDCACM